MREISLTQGKVALVDVADYDNLNQWNWSARKDKSGNFYAVRNSSKEKGNRYTIYMAREILGLKRGDKREGDHQNHNTLDNRRTNIRICTSQQNQFNKIPKTKTSIYKGVSWHKCSKKWRATISINGRCKHLGTFLIEKIAALAYDTRAIYEFGNFAHLNFN